MRKKSYELPSVQPLDFLLLSPLSRQCLYYGPKQYSKLKSGAVLLSFLAFFAGLETGLVWAIRVHPLLSFRRLLHVNELTLFTVPQAGTAKGTNAPLLLFGILSAILLMGALLCVLVVLPFSSSFT